MFLFPTKILLYSAKFQILGCLLMRNKQIKVEPIFILILPKVHTPDPIKITSKNEKQMTSLMKKRKNEWRMVLSQNKHILPKIGKKHLLVKKLNNE